MVTVPEQRRRMLAVSLTLLMTVGQAGCLTACGSSGHGVPSAAAWHAAASTGTSSRSPSAPPVGAVAGTASPTPSGTAASTAAAVSRRCAKPAFSTSARDGGWETQGYFVYNNMWNDSVPLGPQTLYACAFNNWYVISNQTNSAGAVKTYPNVHRDYHDARISSFHGITSSFAATSPRVGIYNVAFDIWTNGIATAGSTEIMIWTDNYKQVPAGKKVTSVTLNGQAYDAWKTSDNTYIALVARTAMTAATIDVLGILKWTIAQGWLATGATLGQIGYGVEIVYTAGAGATFTFTNFSLSSS
jgi:hypothetical protein